MGREELIEILKLKDIDDLIIVDGSEEINSVALNYEVLADHLIENGVGLEDEARIYSLQMADGKIDMKVGGKEFSNFVNMLYQTFKQNGGKNFFTTSFGFDRDSDHYEMTIQKINGQGTAEKLSELKHRADVAEEALDIATKHICDSCAVKCCSENCFAGKAYLSDYFKQQATKRLKERK